MTARTERPVVAYRVAVAAVLAAGAALLLWNAWRYDWLRGYDAFANDQYARILSTEYRLPSASESGSWHTPPLWFALAGALRRAATSMGWEPAQRPGSCSPPRPGSPSASSSSCWRGSSGRGAGCSTSSPSARLGVTGARSRLGHVPPRDARDRARRRRRARRGPRTAEARTPLDGVGAGASSASRRLRGCGRFRSSSRWWPSSASTPGDADAGPPERRCSRRRSCSSRRGSPTRRSSRQRPRLQSPTSDGIDPRAAAAELLPRPARPPGLRPSRDAALSQRLLPQLYTDWWATGR